MGKRQGVLRRAGVSRTEAEWRRLRMTAVVGGRWGKWRFGKDALSRPILRTMRPSVEWGIQVSVTAEKALCGKEARGPSARGCFEDGSGIAAPQDDGRCRGAMGQVATCKSFIAPHSTDDEAVRRMGHPSSSGCRDKPCAWVEATGESPENAGTLVEQLWDAGEGYAGGRGGAGQVHSGEVEGVGAVFHVEGVHGLGEAGAAGFIGE